MRLSSLIEAVSLCHLAVANAAFTWKNVHIGGGGGFIPGIVFNQGQKGVAYARADIGGIYKLNADDSWTAITDNISQDASWHNLGIDALALDPQNANAIYAAVGMYTNSWDPNNGAIIRSLDGGSTWASSNLTFKVGGNMPGRGMGERLAVDPHNSKIIYFGARSSNGLWKSTDGGVTFSKVSSFTAVGTYIPDPTDTTGYNSDIQGLAFVTFDSTSALLSGATSRIFVGTAVKGGNSVYVSNDAGATWAAVPGQPTANLPHKCKLQPTEKALYLTYSNTSGPYDGGVGSVNRFDITTGTWKDISPVNGTNLYFGFGGLGVDMQKPGTLVVASLNSWWPDAQLFRSTDSGTTWSPIWEWTSYPSQNLYYSWNTNKAPWIANSMDQTPGDFTLQLGWMIESLEIDPFDSDHWLYGTGETIYGGHDLTKWDTVHNVTISSLADGIEEFAVQDLKSVPGGTELLVAVGDDGGFTFSTVASLGTSPAIEWETPEVSTNSGVDYAGNKPSNIVRCGSGTDGTPQVGVSTDGGKTWNIDYGTSGANYGGKIAYSADGDTVLWSSSQGVLVSQYTNAFKAVSSVPSGAAIASDKRNGTVLYAGGVSDGSFYVSVNTGQSFTKATSLSGATAVHAIAANPTVAGDIWVSADSGLFHSTNYGSTFTKPSTALSNVYGVALGKGSGSYWNVYAFGTGASGAGLYGSGDSGVSWTYIQGAIGFGSISGCALAASPNQANLVYVGGNGRGVFQGTGALSGSTAPSTSTASSTSTTSSKPTSTTSSSVPTTTKPTSSHTTTLVTQTSTTSKPVGTGAPVPKYGQCGGQGYTGSTVCASGSTCQAQNPYYSQCV